MLLVSPVDLLVMVIFAFMFGWVLYNLPPLVVGILQLRRRSGFGGKNGDAKIVRFPFFSLFVPMKNEGKVAERLLNALVRLNYPSDRYEVLVVDDGSVDNTSEVCRSFEEAYPGRVRYLYRDRSCGKPSALNYGLRFARGDIVGVFDADNVPDPEVLLRAAGYFEDSNVVAVQGVLSSINADENILTKLISYESMLQHFAFLAGKDKLGLFVPFAGTCQFVRRDVLEKVGGWLDDALAEDMELSARLTEKGYYVKFASDVKCWQEDPSSFGGLIRQRTRWFRGCIDVAVKYGRLLRSLNRRSFDAEVFFAGPFIMVFVLFSYFLGLITMFVPVNFSVYVSFLAQSLSVLTFFSLFLLGAGLAYSTKPRRIGNVRWLPVIYAYWFTQVFIAFYALLLFVFRRPCRWSRTPKTGAVTDPNLISLLSSGYAVDLKVGSRGSD